MFQTDPEQYVSFVAASYLWPIARLVEAVHERDLPGPNDVQASVIENGYSAATFVLIVVLLESFCHRGMYLRSENPTAKVMDFLRGALSPHEFRRARELFVVRDVLAHNHRWDATVYYDQAGSMKFASAELARGYGDAKFRDSVVIETRTTRKLGLNVFPTRVGRSDVTIALKETLRILESFERLDERIVKLEALHVHYRNDVLPFKRWAEDL